MNLYEVKVQGVVLVQGESHADVKECIRQNTFTCPGSQIKFLDIDKITLIKEYEEAPIGEVRSLEKNEEA